MANLQAVGWAKVFGPLVFNGPAPVIAGYFSIPDATLYASFRLMRLTVDGTPVDVQLLFGFDDADAAVAQNGIAFDTLPGVSVLESSLAAMTWQARTSGQVVPEAQGSAPAFLPPRVAVNVLRCPDGQVFELYACLAHLL